MNFGVQLWGVMNGRKGEAPGEIFRGLREAGAAFAEPCVALFPIPGL